MKCLTAVLMLAAVPAMADGPQLSANPYTPNSTGNPYGIYGSPNSPVSATNPYGLGISVETVTVRPVSEPVINVWTEPPAAHIHDFSGLSTVGSPQSGLQFEAKARPAVREDTDLKQAMPEPQSNIIDALDGIRKEAAR